MHVTFDSTAEALRRTAAHGRLEEQIEHSDRYWPNWYAQYLVQEQAEHPGQTSPGADA
jgi:hypothetical protein